MKRSSDECSVWLYDRTEWWCDTVRAILEPRGIAVRTFGELASLLTSAAMIDAPPAATIVCCTMIDAGLVSSVDALAKSRHTVLVLTTAVEDLSLTRVLFHAGAADVAPRFPSAAVLLPIIEQAIPQRPRQRRRVWARPGA